MNANKTPSSDSDKASTQKDATHKEGGLKAPQRAPIPFEDPLYYDEADFEKELRRVADICHTCRRCFNLCKSFPKLFDAFDTSKTGEVDSLTREDFQPAIDACTLCDMCFMVKCPYVPPHPFNIDFPKLMLRARAIEARKKGIGFAKNQLTKTDRNGSLGCKASGLANWATKTSNKLTRPIVEKVTGVDQRADLPHFDKKTFDKGAVATRPNPKAPGFGEKAVLYTTCFVNYHNAAIGQAALKVLAHNGIDVEVFYPGCCGMPRLEQGCVEEVALKAKRLSQQLHVFAEKGLPIITLVPSCTLMITHEWPLLHPKDPVIQKVAESTQDITTFLVALSKRKGLSEGLESIKEGVTLHIPCHARAQNKGRQAELLLRHLPNTSLNTLERCSGHGGSWGIFKENFQDALDVGKPVMRGIAKDNKTRVVSECPLAAAHLKQGVDLLSENKKAGQQTSQPVTQPAPGGGTSCASGTPCQGSSCHTLSKAGQTFEHPIVLMARAWGLCA